MTDNNWVKGMDMVKDEGTAKVLMYKQGSIACAIALLKNALESRNDYTKQFDYIFCFNEYSSKNDWGIDRVKEVELLITGGRNEVDEDDECASIWQAKFNTYAYSDNGHLSYRIKESDDLPKREYLNVSKSGFAWLRSLANMPNSVIAVMAMLLSIGKGDFRELMDYKRVTLVFPRIVKKNNRKTGAIIENFLNSGEEALNNFKYTAEEKYYNPLEELMGLAHNFSAIIPNFHEKVISFLCLLNPSREEFVECTVDLLGAEFKNEENQRIYAASIGGDADAAKEWGQITEKFMNDWREAEILKDTEEQKSLEESCFSEEEEEEEEE